jgi:hypothetical protein
MLNEHVPVALRVEYILPGSKQRPDPVEVVEQLEFPLWVVYAQVIRRPDRDQLRAEMRGLLGARPAEHVSQGPFREPERGPSRQKDDREKAEKGSELER